MRMHSHNLCILTLVSLTFLLLVWINRPSSDGTATYVSELVNVVRRGWVSEEAGHEAEPAQPAPVDEEDEEEADGERNIRDDKEVDPRAPVPFCSNEDRISFLQQQCGGSIGSLSDVPDQQIIPFYANTFVDTKHKLLGCLPPKSGCTTWKNILANNSQEEPLPKDFRMMSLHSYGILKYGIHTLSAYNASMRQYFLDNYFKMMIARHPFERFRSAYIDKLQSGSDRFMQVKYGKPILQKFHPEYPQSQINDARGVTMSEFARFIKLTSTMNPHWEPVTDLCLPCHVKYHRILKTETLDHDNEYVIVNHMAPHYRGLGTRGNIMAGGSQAASISRQGRHLDRFDNITLSDLSFLQKFYRNDFKYFGYSWNYRKDTEGTEHVHASCVKGGRGDACC